MTRISAPGVLSTSQRLLLVLIVLLLLSLSAWGVYHSMTARADILIWDFHIPWSAIRAMLHEGANPYSEQVTLQTEMEMLGRPAGEQEFELRLELAYPLYVLALYGPLTFLPLPVAQAIWFTILEASLLALIFVATRAVGWNPRGWQLGLAGILSIGLYSDLWALYLGQMSVVVAAFVAASWWGIKTERWTLAGVLLALSTMKPQMVFLFVPGVLAWAIYRRRWRLIATFCTTMGLLIALPMPWLPAWPLAWLNAMQRYTGYTIYKSPLSLLLGSPWLVGLVGTVLLTWAAYRSWHVPDQSGSALDWMLSMLLVSSALLAPRTSHVNQIILLLPLFFIFSQMSRPYLIVVVGIGLLVSIWALDVLLPPTPASGLEHMIWQHRTISPILPVGLAVALLFVGSRLPRKVADAGV